MNFSVSFVEDDSYQSDELEGRYNEVYTADALIIGKGEEFDPESSIDDIKLYAKEILYKLMIYHGMMKHIRYIVRKKRPHLIM